MKTRIHSFIFFVLLSLPLLARDDLSTSPVSLAELAQKSDAIMLAQVRDTDYFYRREYPVNGSAYLKVLIPYKLDQPADIIEIHEQGLHENECYFPNPTVFEEGRRYLLFLKNDPENPESFRGLAEGCALDVLVDENNQYALRYPVSGIKLSNSLEELVREMTFSDPYAIENEDSLTSTERNILLEAELIRPYVAPSADVEPDAFAVPGNSYEGKQWIYTKAIDLTTIRQLMGLEGINQ
jgi:hypothetical protein